ncbi:hypothetical protein ABBQ32_000411 [Trebouxia sp. C0010 RCD-2024]
MASAKPSRTRPTNNQLLYKAHFRWKHYPQIRVAADFDLPDVTEACASVTSAFLQVLSTLYAAESVRSDQDRNILELLSNNTRRTKVVELSSGTHRVPDELKRHSLTDKFGSQYSTNLDRNRYGTDNQYLSTVIRYDLDYLNLCPCLIDVEIIDAKNGNGTVIVSAGDHACSCTSQPLILEKRQDRQQQHQQASTVRGRLVPGGKGVAAPDADISSDETHAKASVKGDVAGALAFAAPSKSGGSELFDALLMAATGGTETTNRGRSTGEPPVNSKQSVQGGPRPRSRLCNHGATSAGEADSLQNAINAFTVEEEIASGPHELESSFARTGPRSGRGTRPCTPIPRRGSVSNRLDQSTAQDGSHLVVPTSRAATSNGLIPSGPAGAVASRGWSPTDESAEAVNGCRAEDAERSGDDGPTFSLHSQEGDTEAAIVANDQDLEGGDAGAPHDLGPRRARGSKSNLLQGVARQSSAVNLTTLARDSDLKRLIEEVRMMKDERGRVEGALEEARCREGEQRRRAEGLKQDLDLQRAQAQRHLTQVSALRVDVQRLNHGKRTAEARAVAAENAAQHAQHELAALKMLTASMLGQPHGGAGGPFQEPESIESVKPGSTLQTSSSVVDTLTQQRGSCALEEAPSSGNFWSQVPSPSNIQSSQSSVLDGLTSASLPIDQLQLKAGSFPRLPALQSAPALSAPQFWGSASVESNIQLPVGAVGIQAGAYGIQGSPQMPPVSPLQMPWLTSWHSQSVPVTVAQPASLCKEGMPSEVTLKRGRDQKANGMSSDSTRPSKRMTLDKSQPEKLERATESTAHEPNSKLPEARVKEQVQPGQPSSGLDTESPNTSSHSSSPEAGPLRAAGPANFKVM